MNKVLGMLEAGNAACKANSIHKTMSFSFSPQNGGYNHLFLFHLTAVFGREAQHLKKTVSIALQFNPAALSMGVG